MTQRIILITRIHMQIVVLITFQLHQIEIR